MDDEMDLYLSRSLKNWAARRQPPTRGKERLLRAIVAPHWLSARPSSGALQPPKEFHPSDQAVYLPGIMMKGSFTLSLAWPVHIATLVNLAQ